MKVAPEPAGDMEMGEVAKGEPVTTPLTDHPSSEALDKQPTADEIADDTDAAAAAASSSSAAPKDTAEEDLNKRVIDMLGLEPDGTRKEAASLSVNNTFRQVAAFRRIQARDYSLKPPAPLPRCLPFINSFKRSGFFFFCVAAPPSEHDQSARHGRRRQARLL